MSDPNATLPAVAEADEPVTAEPKAPMPKLPAPMRHRWIIIGLGGALLLAVVLVASAPVWAPLLPWASAPAGTEPAPAPGNQPVTPPRPEDRPQEQQQEAAASAALQALDRRLGALEARPAAPANGTADLRQLPARLAGNLADLEARVGALEARPAAPASDIDDIRQLLARLTSSVADLDARVGAFGKAAPAPPPDTPAAVDATDMALVLALLQIRGALEAGRPFAAEYEALATLARTRPEIVAAVAPLADPAKTGVAGRAVLAKRLRELAGAIAAATVPENTPASVPADANGGPASDWVGQALIRLRGLVTVQRVDGAAPRQPGGGPTAAVNAAELALAGGDLAGALGALDTLAGPSAEAAGPWLRMARERLAVEAALDRTEALLVARLGATANAAGAAPVNDPATVPSAVPAGPGSPR